MMSGPAWIPCPEGCGEFWCAIHQEHASDCPCPSVEDWEWSPYEPPPKKSAEKIQMPIDAATNSLQYAPMNETNTKNPIDNTAVERKLVRRFKLTNMGQNLVRLNPEDMVTHLQYTQNGVVEMYVLVILAPGMSAEDEPNFREFHVTKTGECAPEPSTLVGTAALPGMPALHVWELV